MLPDAQKNSKGVPLYVLNGQEPPRENKRKGYEGQEPSLSCLSLRVQV